MLVYDTCENGTLTDDSFAYQNIERATAATKLKRALGRSVLSATTATNPALEGYKGHGIFTYALLEALGNSDKNENGEIELTEIADHLERTVPKISLKRSSIAKLLS